MLKITSVNEYSVHFKLNDDYYFIREDSNDHIELYKKENHENIFIKAIFIPNLYFGWIIKRFIKTKEGINPKQNTLVYSLLDLDYFKKSMKLVGFDLFEDISVDETINKLNEIDIEISKLKNKIDELKTQKSNIEYFITE